MEPACLRVQSTSCVRATSGAFALEGSCVNKATHVGPIDHLQIYHLQRDHLQIYHLQIDHLQIDNLLIYQLQIYHLQIDPVRIYHLQMGNL